MSLGSRIDEIITGNRDAIVSAAERIARTHRDDALVYTAGSGHSLAMVMETYFRAGGLAIVRPLFHEDLLPLNGAARSTAAEREPGLGQRVIAAADPGERDTVVVFSNSGRNPYPVEIALGARERGAQVVAFTSVAVSRANAPRAQCRLYEAADIVLDTGTPPGDVSRPIEAPVTSPLSTLMCCALWAEVLAATVEIEPRVPLWRSANRDGNDEFNSGLVRRLCGRIPEL